MAPSIDMHLILDTYRSLLADVARLSGFSEIRGSCVELQWCLNEAPKLEKLILASIETGESLDLDSFPESLRRLAAGSLVDPALLRYMRQLLLFSYKANITHDITTTEKAFKAFSDVNASVLEFSSSLATRSSKLLDKARRHCQSVLSMIQKKDMIPSHGPGASTTPKEIWSSAYSTIDCTVCAADWFALYFNADHNAELADRQWHEEITAKLIAVPKDSRGPRLICVHPAEAIWVQQAIRRALEKSISRKRYAKGPWPQGHIFFDNQDVNGKIALLSSKSRVYATLDMKEASDRISDCLVQILFGSKYKMFGCCRAQKVLIPATRENPSRCEDIHSYAPMGNATTFPVQSLVFWAICVASLQSQGFHQPGAVFVFGDDIIVPSRCAEVVINDLESFGLLVNRTKSFWRGAFRESCGVDAFNGVNVTPIRWKTCADAKHLTGLLQLSDLAMRLRIAGYEDAAVTVYCGLRERLRRYGFRLSLTNNRDHGGIAEYTELTSQVWRDSYWSKRYQCFVSPVLRLQGQDPVVKARHWNDVLESLCSLERGNSGRINPDRTSSRRFRLNRGWTWIM